MRSETALITGASKGIGRACALALAKTGINILATGRNLKDLKSLKNEITENAGNCNIYPADLTHEDDLESLVDMMHTHDISLKILIHSAGVARIGKVENMAHRDWQDVLAINLTAPFFLTQKCLPSIIEGGRIFFINSVAGKMSFSEWSAYCASKYGLKALADALRQEVAAQKITVTSIFPASVDTAMQDALPYDWDRAKMLKANDVARAIVACIEQPDDIVIKDLTIENAAGVF